MDVKSLILPKEEEKKEEKKSATVRTKPTVEYHVELESGCDFAIRRKTVKTSRLLVILMSQGQFYIKDENTEAITNLNSEELRKFMAAAEGDIPLESCTWLRKMEKGKNFCEVFMDKITQKNNQEAAKKGSWYIGCRDSIPPIVFWAMKEYANQNDIDLRDVMSKYNRHAYGGIHSFGRMTDVLLEFEKDLGTDNARRLIKEYLVSDINKIPLGVSYVRKVLCDVGTHPRTFKIDSLIEHAVYECQRQGYAFNPDVFWQYWGDCYSMEKLLYGKVKTKYPKDLATYHQKLSYICQLNREKIDAERWKWASDNMSKYEYKGEKYSIISPKSAEDMHKEAQQQCNCLASYVQRVINGESLIFFMRANDAIDDSLITIEVFPNGRVNQVKAANNRTPCAEHIKFVKRWADKMGFEYPDIAA